MPVTLPNLDDRRYADLVEEARGLVVANAPALVEAGADFLAVSAGVWDHAEGPQAAVRAFNALF